MNFREQELLELAGKDARAMLLLSKAYDDAMQADPDVDVEAMLVHCYQTDDPKLLAQLRFNCGLLYVRVAGLFTALDSGEEQTIAEQRRQLLDEVFKLRHGEWPCDCGYSVSSMRPWKPGWPMCEECYQASLRRQRHLKVVA